MWSNFNPINIKFYFSSLFTFPRIFSIAALNFNKIKLVRFSVGNTLWSIANFGNKTNELPFLDETMIITAVKIYQIKIFRRCSWKRTANFKGWITMNALVIETQTFFVIKTKKIRSSHRRCSIEIGVLKKFTNLSLFFNKNAGRPAALLKKRLWHKCFPVNFVKFFKTPFLQNTSGRLLLEIVICWSHSENQKWKYINNVFFELHIISQRESYFPLFS